MPFWGFEVESLPMVPILGDCYFLLKMVSR